MERRRLEEHARLHAPPACRAARRAHVYIYTSMAAVIVFYFYIFSCLLDGIIFEQHVRLRGEQGVAHTFILVRSMTTVIAFYFYLFIIHDGIPSEEHVRLRGEQGVEVRYHLEHPLHLLFRLRHRPDELVCMRTHI